MKNTTPSRKSALNITLSLGLITSLSLLSAFSSSSNALTKPLSFSSLIERYQKNQQLEMSIMHLDLDYIYDPDPRQMTRNINQLIKRIETVQPNTIFLQAYADEDANGSANEVYFPNPHMPVREDLFKKVTEQIRNRTTVKKIYAWLPMWAWELPKHYRANYVETTNQNIKGYIRLSPFDPKNFDYVYDIYKALTDKITVDGILYHDDITLNDYEDSSPSAMQVYKYWGFKDAEKILRHPQHPEQAGGDHRPEPAADERQHQGLRSGADPEHPDPGDQHSHRHLRRHPGGLHPRQGHTPPPERAAAGTDRGDPG